MRTPKENAIYKLRREGRLIKSALQTLWSQASRVPHGPQYIGTAVAAEAG